MSTTVETNTTTATILQIVQQTTYFLTRDIQATPLEVAKSKTGECGRSTFDLVAEMATFNSAVAAALNGTPKDMRAEFAKTAELAASFQTVEDAVNALQASVAEATAAIQATADWDTVIMAPWGMESTKANIASWVALHNAYHDGQINYVQVLNGDEAMHWM